MHSSIVPAREPKGKSTARPFWQKTPSEQPADKGFIFIEVENPSLLSNISSFEKLLLIFGQIRILSLWIFQSRGP
jgi:hypothetical protein